MTGAGGTVGVLVNGQARELAAGTDVAAVVQSLAGPAAGTAVAVNGQVLPRAEWPRTPVLDGDEIEVLTAVQGG